MNIFEFVKSKVSILDVVSEYVTLKPAGRYWKGPSPFKHERVPSFTVSPHKEIYYCFSSAQGGDVINFIAAIERCTPLEAAQYLVDRYKLQVPDTIEWKKAPLSDDMNKRERYEKSCSFFAYWCHLQLQKSIAAQKYLNQRSINSTSIEQFQLGYCPSGVKVLQDLVTQAQKQALLMQDFYDAHILMDGKQGLYSPYEERIIFPIHNHVGSCCGFGGRVFRETDERAKYYNSHEHVQFNKSGLLFGLHKAKKKIQETGVAFLVEGYLDCIAMVQAGYMNTIATLGTACTIDHLKQIARHAKKLYVVYDGDQAGQKAVIRLAQLCWQANMELLIVTLPEDEDPASFLAKGNNLELQKMRAENLFLFSIKQFGNQFFSKSLQEKLSYIHQLLEIIAPINDPLQKDLLLHTMATTFDMPFETLKNHLYHKKPVRDDSARTSINFSLRKKTFFCYTTP
jgi:DNA primase